MEIINSMNKFAEDTAVGIITCNRPHFLKILLDSLDPTVGDIYVINSGDKFELDDSHRSKIKELIQCKVSPTPVGHAKNTLLRKMRHSGKKYLFLVEDDVKVKDNKVFEKYIETAADTGLWAGQLSYGLHGGVRGGNVKRDGTPNVRKVVDYTKTSISLFPQSFQAFTLYHSNTLKVIGYFDDFYINAAEHLDHYLDAFLKGIGNYFWWFPDIEDSGKYLEDIDQNHDQSVIRKTADWKVNMTRSWQWFKQKHGYFPSDVPQHSEEEVLDRLNFLETNYSQKQLNE